jgi:enoyl-CoA hydratase/carnithine racemase
MGLVTEVVVPGEYVTRALEIAERIGSFPQATLLADPRGLPPDVAAACICDPGCCAGI